MFSLSPLKGAFLGLSLLHPSTPRAFGVLVVEVQPSFFCYRLLSQLARESTLK